MDSGLPSSFHQKMLKNALPVSLKHNLSSYKRPSLNDIHWNNRCLLQKSFL